jgi:glycosyltransferase involved in cell wall biosynthesis
MDISVAITTRGRPADFARTAAAVTEQLAASPAQSELIVVFDGCEPYAGDWLNHLSLTPKVLVDSTRLGVGGARNRALAAADGDVFAIIDDDGMPAPEWVAALERGLKEYPERFCFGGRVSCSHQAPNVVAKLRDEVYYRETFGDWYLAADGSDSGDLLAPPYVNGGNCAYRVQVFERFGPFREDLPAYIDVEFGLRVNCPAHGVLLDGFSIRHAHPTQLRAYLRRAHTSGRARSRLRHHAAHRPRVAIGGVAGNLAWRNAHRAARVGSQRLLAFGILTLQEVTHGHGYLRP